MGGIISVLVNPAVFVHRVRDETLRRSRGETMAVEGQAQSTRAAMILWVRIEMRSGDGGPCMAEGGSDSVLPGNRQ